MASSSLSFTQWPGEFSFRSPQHLRGHLCSPCYCPAPLHKPLPTWLYVQFFFLHLLHRKRSVVVPPVLAIWCSRIASWVKAFLNSLSSSLAISWREMGLFQGGWGSLPFARLLESEWRRKYYTGLGTQLGETLDPPGPS